MTAKPKPCVLLVDDEDVVRNTLRLALESEELQIATAVTAEEALALLRTTDYELLIVDKNLPGMSGIDLLREARGLNPDMRAFLITGYASIDAALETLHLRPPLRPRISCMARTRPDSFRYARRPRAARRWRLSVSRRETAVGNW